MKYIRKQAEPDSLKKWKKKFENKGNHKPQYADLEKYPDVKQELKQHLLDEQKNLCGYCCTPILPMTTHIEHIKPKGVPKYASLSLSYDNLMGCCRPSPKNSHCGDSKKNKYDEKLFISPYDAACNQYFKYLAYTGEVQAKDSNPRAKYMIDILNLNEPSLKKARIETYWASGIEEMTIDDLSQLEKDIENTGNYPYMDAISYILQERISEYNE